MAITFNGKEGVSLYRLMTLETGLKLESKGIRLTAKAPKCSVIVKREFSLKRNASIEECLAAVRGQITQMREANERGEYPQPPVESTGGA